MVSRFLICKYGDSAEDELLISTGTSDSIGWRVHHASDVTISL